MPKNMRLILPMLIAVFVFCSTAQAQYKCLEGDCFKGKGKKVLEDGSGSLEGDFWEGSLVSGKVVFPNGDVFEGEFKGTELMMGSKHFKNGTILSGKFIDSILVDGKITYPDGTSNEVHMGAYKPPVPTAKLPMQPPRLPVKP